MKLHQRKGIASAVQRYVDMNHSGSLIGMIRTITEEQVSYVELVLKLV